MTVTLNAALDVRYEVPGVDWSGVNRVPRVRQRAGGRGVRVARMLAVFGHDVVAAGLAGGAAGEEIRVDLARSGVLAAFTAIGHPSRRTVTITDSLTGGTAVFQEPGPYITTEELGRFARDYRALLADADAVVLGGSLPLGLPPEIYASLARYAAEAGVPVVLDADGEALRYGLAGRPAIVKIGERELRELTGEESILAGAEALRELGAGAVVVPIGGGAVLAVTEHGPYGAALQEPVAAESPGSAAALVAGLVPGLLLDWPWPDPLRHAAALAAAADSADDIDLAAYERLLAQVGVEAL